MRSNHIWGTHSTGLAPHQHWPNHSLAGSCCRCRLIIPLILLITSDDSFGLLKQRLWYWFWCWRWCWRWWWCRCWFWWWQYRIPS